MKKESGQEYNLMEIKVPENATAGTIRAWPDDNKIRQWAQGKNRPH